MKRVKKEGREQSRGKEEIKGRRDVSKVQKRGNYENEQSKGERTDE